MALFPASSGGGDSSDVVGTAKAIGTVTVNGTTYTKYRKVIDGGTVTYTDGMYEKAHGISNLHGVTSVCAYLVTGSGNYAPLPFLATSAYNASVNFVVTPTNLQVTAINGTSLANTHLWCTLEYY